MLMENALLVTREETYLRNDEGELRPLDAIGYDSVEEAIAAQDAADPAVSTAAENVGISSDGVTE